MPLTFERIRASAAASILGVEVRTVQALASRGQIPGAAKIGGTWTFDESALRTWIREKAECQTNRQRQNTHIGAEKHCGRDLPLTVAKSVKACEQALQRLRRGA